MRNNKISIFTSIFILIIAIGCNSTKQLYHKDDKNSIYTGKLSDSTFVNLIQYLAATTKSQPKDTIIIKYDYNNETCWDISDQKEDGYVKPFIPAQQERVKKILAARQNVSILAFREPGQNLNKIKKWDNSIIIDSEKYLFNLLFKERCICGSSIIVMPDKRFVFIRSDSHSEAMDYTQTKIIAILLQQ